MEVVKRRNFTLQLTSCPICNSNVLEPFVKVSTQMHSSNEKFTYDQCAACNTVMLNPRLAFEDLKDYYTEYYLPYRGATAWGKYRKQVENDQQQLDKKRLQVLQDCQQLTSDTIILDVGCGKPSFLYAAHQRYSVKAIGVDFSDHGWRNEPIYKRNLNLISGELGQIQLKCQPDFVTMWHYLEHDYFPNKTLRHIAKLASPQTHLVIEVPNFDSESRKKYGENWAGWHTPRHTFLFSPNNLKLLLENNGWKVKELRTYGTLSDYLLYWISEMEVKNIDWRKNMENEFLGFAGGLVKHKLKNTFIKHKSHGIMLAIATLA